MQRPATVQSGRFHRGPSVDDYLTNRCWSILLTPSTLVDVIPHSLKDMCDMLPDMTGSRGVPASAVGAVAVLEDGLRQRMYQFIRRAGRPVTREEAAAEVGISRKLAAFHLDKLVAAGLLEAGKGDLRNLRRAGRKPKAYRAADVDIQISIPERRPVLLAEMLLDAVVTAGDAETMRDGAFRVAAERGFQQGVQERQRSRGRWGTERSLSATRLILERHGYEPAREGACLRLRNCPFHPLAARAPDFVCGMNQRFVAGILDGLQAPTLEAALRPAPGECCVRLQPVGEPSGF